MEFIPGFLQGLTRVIISYPFDYIRTNIQTQEYKNIFSYLYQKKLTVKDAYRGCSIQLLSVPIDRSIQFYLFEKICILMEQKNHLNNQGILKIGSLAFKMNPSGKRKYTYQDLMICFILLIYLSYYI
jgi:hypothetical protein